MLKKVGLIAIIGMIVFASCAFGSDVKMVKSHQNPVILDIGNYS